MALYINKQELVHRISNGFITHDGYVNGEFYDIYKKHDIDIFELGNKQLMNCIAVIIDSMGDSGVNLYPMTYRGAKVRSIRMEKGIRITDLSRKTGICKTALYRLESGKSKPFPETMHKIANALGVDVSEFS